MDDTIKLLFQILIGFVLANMAISIILYLVTRQKEYLRLVFYWAIVSVVFVVQGAFQVHPIHIALAFTVSAIPIFYITWILLSAIDRKLSIKLYVGLIFSGLATTFLLYRLNVPFKIFALPLSVAVASPFFEAIYWVFFKRRKSSTKIQKFLAGVMVVGIIHCVNFALFRMEDGAQIWGWMVSFILYQMFSVLLPAFVVERMAKTEKQKLAKANENLLMKIKERKRSEKYLLESEEKLKVSEEKYRSLIESLQDNFILYSHNTEGVFTYISPSIMNVLGYSQEEFLAHYSKYMTDNPDNEKVIKYTDLTLKGIKQPPYEVEIHHNSGSVRTLKVQEVPVFDKEGKVVAVEGIAEDITNRKKSEALLQASKNQLQSILDNTTAVVYIKDRGGKYVLINQQYETLFNVSREDIVGKTDMDIHPEEIAKAFRSNDRKVFDAGVPLELEEIAPHDDGPHTYLSLKFPLFNPDGTSDMVCGISTDITKRKKAEEILWETKEKYLSLTNDILNSSMVGIFVLDSKFSVVCVNQAIERFFGIRKEDVIGKDKKHLICEHIKDIFENPKTFMEKVIATYDNNTYVERFECRVLPDGKREDRYLEHWSMPITTGTYKGGRIEQYTDITSRKKTENKLKDLNLELQEQDTKRIDFLSTVSHEIRTPLTLVLGFVHMIEKKLENVLFPLINIDSDKVNRTVNQIKTNINTVKVEGVRLTSLIDDMLDISKMEEGKSDLKREHFSVAVIIGRALEVTNSFIEMYQIDMVEDIESELPEVIGDIDKITQVVINLISNAMKFTDEGPIICRARKINNEVIISVIDKGVGIADADQEKIFEKFSQVRSEPKGRPKGTGLGLAICKNIVEQHGGRIWVESKLGVGSSFSFSIPSGSE